MATSCTPLNPLASSFTPKPTRPSSAQLWSKKLFALQHIPETQRLSFHTPGLKGGCSFAVCSREDVALTSEKWKDALQGCFAGKRPYLPILLSALEKAWKAKGSFEVFPRPDDTFIITFSSLDDRTSILNSGPWFILGRYMHLRPWSRFIRSKKELFDSLPTWIRLPNLPLHLWSPDSIGRIASVIGKPLYLDESSANTSKLQFARVCVEISASKPLPRSVMVEVEGGEDEVYEQIIEYEQVVKICSKCKIFGHLDEGCVEDSNLMSTIKRKTDWKSQGVSFKENGKSVPNPPTSIPVIPLKNPGNAQQTEVGWTQVQSKHNRKAKKAILRNVSGNQVSSKDVRTRVASEVDRDGNKIMFSGDKLEVRGSLAATVQGLPFKEVCRTSSQSETPAPPSMESCRPVSLSRRPTEAGIFSELDKAGGSCSLQEISLLCNEISCPVGEPVRADEGGVFVGADRDGRLLETSDVSDKVGENGKGVAHAITPYGAVASDGVKEAGFSNLDDRVVINVLHAPHERDPFFESNDQSAAGNSPQRTPVSLVPNTRVSVSPRTVAQDFVGPAFPVSAPVLGVHESAEQLVFQERNKNPSSLVVFQDTTPLVHTGSPNHPLDQQDSTILNPSRPGSPNQVLDQPGSSNLNSGRNLVEQVTIQMHSIVDDTSDSEDGESYFPPGFTPTREDVMSLRELMKEGASSVPPKFQKYFVKSVDLAEDSEIVDFFREKLEETVRKDGDTNFLTHQNVRRSPRMKKTPARLSDPTRASGLKKGFLK